MMNEIFQVIAVRTFQNKQKTERYYTAECISKVEQATPNFKGLNQITVFLTEKQYGKLYNDFVPYMEVELAVTLMGNRVSYSLVS